LEEKSKEKGTFDYHPKKVKFLVFSMTKK